MGGLLIVVELLCCWVFVGRGSLMVVELLCCQAFVGRGGIRNLFPSQAVFIYCLHCFQDIIDFEGKTQAPTIS